MKVREKRFTIRRMTRIALMTALLCVLGPLSVPIGPVPISLTTMAVFLSVYAIGMTDGVIATLLYILLGAFGLPVFSGFAGGLGKLLGPTGGYIIGFLFMATVAGIFIDFFPLRQVYWHILGMILGEVVLYIFGTAWFMFSMKMGVKESLSLCVFPFLLFDGVKILFACIIGMGVRTALSRAGLVEYPLRNKA